MLERLNEAMQYVEDHLLTERVAQGDAELDARELAKIAATTEYHFRRMFAELAGMGLAEYVRRRRLTLAGAEVVAGERPLIEIAMRYGYGSGEAFARAFRAQHGVAPSEARRSGANLQSQPRMSFRLIVEGDSSMQYRIVDKPAFKLTGRTARVLLVHEGMNPSIVAFIRGLGQETLERIEALNDQEPRGILGVSINVDESYAEGTELDYWHAVVTNAETPEDLESLDVAAGLWAVFESSGEFPLTLQYAWRDVYTQWFPSNPYASRPGPSLSRTKVSKDGKTAEAELWIPVERAS